MFCGFPSSSSRKSSFFRPSTGLPDLSRTKQLTITSVLLLVKVTVSSFFCCACCGRATLNARMNRSNLEWRIVQDLKPKSHGGRQRAHGLHGHGQTVVGRVHYCVEGHHAWMIGEISSVYSGLNPAAIVSQTEGARQRQIEREHAGPANRI